MILNFRKYKIRAGHSYQDDIIIYPGMQIKVTREDYVVSFHIPGGENPYATDISLDDIPEAKKLMRDIDMFLQYRTPELPEYNL